MKINLLTLCLAALMIGGCSAPRSGVAYGVRTQDSGQLQSLTNTTEEMACIAETTCELVGAYVNAFGRQCKILGGDDGTRKGYCQVTDTYWKPIKFL